MPLPTTGANLIAETNLSDDDLLLYSLARKGYGSVAELNKMDTPEFYDLVEFEGIISAIEAHHINEARRG